MVEATAYLLWPYLHHTEKMRNIKFYLLLLFIMTGSLISMSIPAYPRKIPVLVGDSTVYIRLYGDEYNKRAETLEGYTIIQYNDIWYYAEKDESGYLRPSSFKLSTTYNSSTQLFLKDLPLHLLPEKNNTQNSGIYRRRAEEQRKNAIGERRILVILMQFTDVSFVKNQNDFIRLFNEENYKEDGAYGSVFDYYNDVSYGKLQLTCDVIGPFTSQRQRAYYGKNDRDGNDNSPETLFEEAMEYATQYVQLKDYDADNDGYVDNIHIIFAGHGEEAGASSNAIWSHESTYYEPFIYQDIRVDRYSCAPELRGNTGNGISRIGPHCHEIGHALGAMDYYDTDYKSHGEFEGTGNWDIMASGSWNDEGVIPADFNPYVKMMNFGWVDIKEMPEGEISIGPSLESEYNYYRLSNTESDYYLIENRFDKSWDEALPGTGLMIYHIHPNIENVGNEINATYPQKCYPVCASSNYAIPTSSPSSYGEINTPGCPFPGTLRKQQFNMGSTPACFSWNEGFSNIDLRDITISSNGIITLSNLSSDGSPINSETLTNEDFEQSRNYLINTDEGESKWKWIKIKNGEKGKNDTSPHEGEGYLRFQPGKLSSGEQVSSITFNTPETSESSLASLSFYYQGISYRTGIPVMNISYSCDGKDRETIEIIGNGNSDWKNYSMNLPEAKSYSIKFTGFASFGQTICLDDITIVKKVSTGFDTIWSSESEKAAIKSPTIYDIQGRRLEKPERGMNIIRLSDGTTQKVFVK